MARFLREADVVQLLTMEDALAAVEQAIREQGLGTAVNHPRFRLRGGGAVLQMMTALVPGLNAMGFKVYRSGGGGARSGPGFQVVLFSTESGELLAIMEGSRLGQVRTGAASGVATKYLARSDARSVGVIGTGYQARTQLQAVAAVRPIQQVRAFSRNPENRQKFCQEMTETLGVEVVPAESAQEAVKGADILITITNGREPVLFGEWLEPGVHINAAGANAIIRRELDDEAVRRADFIAVDSKEQAKVECGDLQSPVERGLVRWEQIHELGEVVAGRVPGRQSPQEITLFESHGLALWDMAAAAQVYKRALEQDVGETLPF